MPVSRTCTFCGNDIEPGTGKMYVRRDGTVHFFCSGKCQKNHLHLGRVGRKVRWTRRYVQAVRQQVRRPVVAPQPELEEGPAGREEAPPGEGEEAPAARDRETAIRALAEVPGIGPATAQALWVAGFTSMKELRESTVEALTGVKGIGPATAAKILAQVKEATN